MPYGSSTDYGPDNSFGGKLNSSSSRTNLLAAALQNAQNAVQNGLRVKTLIQPTAVQSQYTQRTPSTYDTANLPNKLILPTKVIAPTGPVGPIGPNNTNAIPTSIKDRIGKVESGGSYSAQSKTSSASGKYQYLDTTWNNYGGYKRAADAPPDVQEKRMDMDIKRREIKYGGDERLIALAHFQGEAVADKVNANPKLWQKKDANGLTAEAYVSSVLEAGKTPAGSVEGDKNRNLNAKTAFEALKQSGAKVNGLGASSADHKKQNPNSDHDTGRAFDWHTTGDEAVKQAINTPGVTYVIHNSTIYHKKDGFKPRYYGGKFANGKAKSDHKSHVHVNF
jgi:hypothetical protein